MYTKVYTHTCILHIYFLTLDLRYCPWSSCINVQGLSLLSDFILNPMHRSIYPCLFPHSNVITKDKQSIMPFMKTSNIPSRQHGICYVEIFVLIIRNLIKISTSEISSFTALLTQQQKCFGRRVRVFV